MRMRGPLLPRPRKRSRSKLAARKPTATAKKIGCERVVRVERVAKSPRARTPQPRRYHMYTCIATYFGGKLITNHYSDDAAEA
jgi:hypothetical protein